jgi:uncharacterized membrane protein
VAGLAASIYLTIAHYDTAKVLACPNTGFINCAKVTSSSYSTQFGIPLAVTGLGFFAVMFVLQLPASWGSRPLSLVRLALSGGGAAFALWLIYVELYRLDAICLYCTLVHALTIALFGVTAIGTALLSSLDAEAPGGG